MAAKLLFLDKAQLIEDYNRGMLLHQLVRKHGLLPNSIYLHLQKADAQHPGTVNWRREQKRNEVAEQYKLRRQTIEEVLHE